MRQVIKVERAQCCVFNNQINRELASMNGVYGVFVDNYKNQITIDHTNEVTIEMIHQKLEENGYNVVGEVSGDSFAGKAEEWDSPVKIEMAGKFVQEMHKNINFNSKLKVLDFGCGTGLAGLQIAPLVRSTVLMDTSAAMIEVLKSKLNTDNEKTSLLSGKISGRKHSGIKIINSEIFNYNQQDIDVVFSLMAMHHIENLNETLNHISSILKPGGILVIGDLKEEDGTFHPEEKVAHNGFNISQLSDMIEGSELEVRKAYVYNSINKNGRDYEQFILIAQK